MDSNQDEVINIFSQIDSWKFFTEMLSVLWMLWPLWLMIVLLLLIRIFIQIIIPNEYKKFMASLKFRKSKQWHSDRELINYLKGLSSREFEEYIASLFDALGYESKVVGKAHDGGVDVVAKKDGDEVYIQCKKYNKGKVNVHDVRDFVGAIAGRVSKGYFITTSIFTLDAIKYSENQPIELIDGKKLIEYILLAENKGWKMKEERNVCPQCGGDLVRRKGKFGEFYGCSKYPKCDYIKKID